MKNLPLVFCGLLTTFMAAWAGIVMASNIQLGHLQPGAAEEGDPRKPQLIVGLASEGKQVYISMGCVYCHTQQVRPASAVVKVEQPKPGKPGEMQELWISPDIARGWAHRGTVARDYILQDRVLLGAFRIGPDLVDVGDRKISESADWLYLHLYDPQTESPGSVMPPYRFLFTLQKIGEKPSPHALNFPKDYSHAPAAGYEVVPTERAKALVAYMRSLKIDYDLPETGEGH